MKKLIVGALVGGFVLFLWQFISWTMLHASNMQYTDQQDEILAFVDGKLKPGEYMLPNVPSGTSQDDHQKMMEPYFGKRWVQINYRDNLNMSMGMNMFRGFVIDFVSVLLLCWLLGKMRDLDMKTSILACIAIGLIGYFSISYLNSIWFETDSIPALIDAVVPWAIIGVWLGWWLKRT